MRKLLVDLLMVGTLTALIAAGMLALASGNSEILRKVPERPGTSGSARERPGCVPFQMANQRLCGETVYTFQNGGWAYTGPLTPLPGVPAR